MKQAKAKPTVLQLFKNPEYRHWIVYGRYYGYPDCCILDFCTRGYIDSLSPAQEAVHEGHGFIPCDACAQKITSGEVTLSSLIQNRIHNEPFPQDGWS